MSWCNRRDEGHVRPDKADQRANLTKVVHADLEHAEMR
jgi:hypothetical protein